MSGATVSRDQLIRARGFVCAPTVANRSHLARLARDYPDAGRRESEYGVALHNGSARDVRECQPPQQRAVLPHQETDKCVTINVADAVTNRQCLRKHVYRVIEFG